MTTQIAGTTFERVWIVDDDENARDGYCDPVSELGVEAAPESGPLPGIDEFVSKMKSQASGVLCDYILRQRNYSEYNGDLLVESLYKGHLPAVLCTRYTDADVTLFRGRRRYIPALLMPSEVDPDNLARGFETCIEEFAGNFQPDRKPWRTLVRIEEFVDDDKHKYMYVVVPGWSPNKKIRLYLEDLPLNVRKVVREDKRLHAQVNIGTESHEQLYFTEWEVD